MYFDFSFLEFHFHYKHLIAIFRCLLLADLQCKKQGANLWPQQFRNRSYACADGKVREKRTSSFEILKPKHIFFSSWVQQREKRRAIDERKRRTGEEAEAATSRSAPFKSKALLVLQKHNKNTDLSFWADFSRFYNCELRPAAATGVAGMLSKDRNKVGQG